MSGTAVAVLTLVSTPTFWVGTTHADQGFVSVVDEARVYERALSATEIDGIYDGMPSTTANIASYVYNGDGSRVEKTESSETTIYVGRFYEKNVENSTVTAYHFQGGSMVALRKRSTLEYVHQDHLGDSSVSTNSSGTQVRQVTYLPFVATRTGTGTLGTDRGFSEQKLDGTGLYFVKGRMYDRARGRFHQPG